jgi:hypothetical protein
VHWYARDASVQTWVDDYNAATGAKDTFVYAPPISLHNYAKKGLPSAGLYSDQVRDSLAGVSSKFLLMISAGHILPALQAQVNS